jgi:hypothetical protein
VTPCATSGLPASSQRTQFPAEGFPGTRGEVVALSRVACAAMTGSVVVEAALVEMNCRREIRVLIVTPPD